MIFYPGLHQPADLRHFPRGFLSINRLRRRRSNFAANAWILDSGAFSEVGLQGGYRTSVAEYAAAIGRWSRCGQLVAAVAQDWMCEPAVLARTGLSIAEHQRRTIARYDALLALSPAVPVLPVLQGWAVDDYVRHLGDYGERLAAGAYVGIGSICRRSGDAPAVARILGALLRRRLLRGRRGEGRRHKTQYPKRAGSHSERAGT